MDLWVLWYSQSFCTLTAHADACCSCFILDHLICLSRDGPWCTGEHTHTHTQACRNARHSPCESSTDSLGHRSGRWHVNPWGLLFSFLFELLHFGEHCITMWRPGARAPQGVPGRDAFRCFPRPAGGVTLPCTSTVRGLHSCSHTFLSAHCQAPSAAHWMSG